MLSIEQKRNDSNPSSFLFGDNPAGFTGFCETAARRLVFFLPIAITFSNSTTIAITYLIGILWLFGGHWRERFSTIFSSGILLATLPLILWTGIGIIRYKDSLFWSAQYWLGHYPYIFIIIIATLLIRKKSRYMALSSMNLAIFLCCLWGIAFTWYYSDLAIGDFWAKRVRTIYLYRNTICFGISLVLWGGLWACFPYTSRHISWLRKIMPRFLLNDMIRASQASLLDFAMVFVPNAPSSLRQYPVALFLSLIRWGIVIGVMFFVFIVNPSRTAQLAIIFGYGTILMAWNLKKGILVTFCILFPFAALLGYSSETFETKSKMTFYDLISFQKAVQSQEELDNFIKDNQDRLSITASLFPDLREKPLLGHGMEKAVKIVNDRTAYNDPHCEFVYIQLQHGAIGLTCFLLWILSLFVVPFRYPLVWKQFGLFMAVLIGMDCVFNNAMSYHRETYLLCISVALIAVIRPKRDFSSTKKNIVR